MRYSSAETVATTGGQHIREVSHIASSGDTALRGALHQEPEHAPEERIEINRLEGAGPAAVDRDKTPMKYIEWRSRRLPEPSVDDSIVVMGLTVDATKPQASTGSDSTKG